MSSINDQQLRVRKPRLRKEGPPVPPKEDRGVHLHNKPLPPTPGLKDTDEVPRRDVYVKPLPRPPQNLNLRATCLWIALFAVWLLLIVLLLPVITEKDAMPSFHRWLRYQLKFSPTEQLAAGRHNDTIGD